MLFFLWAYFLHLGYYYTNNNNNNDNDEEPIELSERHPKETNNECHILVALHGSQFLECILLFNSLAFTKLPVHAS